MSRSLQLGTVFGIRLQVHWTFALLVLWIAGSSLLAGAGLMGAAMRVAFIALLFGCVALHELGHALAARYYGIQTRDITLLPIGGVARLERIPRKPSQELVVALAGPAVNVVIAGLLFLVMIPTVGVGSVNAAALGQANLLQQLLLVNITLVVFNLLPIFPMDGGRVLRALLAMTMNYRNATRIAAAVGQVFALGFVLLSYLNPFLLLIAAFVFFGARAEASQVESLEAMRPFRVRDGMIRGYRAVDADTAVLEFADQMFDSPQLDFPVTRDGQLVGMLYRADVLNALSSRSMLSRTTVAGIMRGGVPMVDEDERLAAVFERLGTEVPRTLPVTSGGILTGLLDLSRAVEIARNRSRLPRPDATDSGIVFLTPSVAR